MVDHAEIAASVGSLQQHLETHRYICSTQIATAVYLAYHLRKPVLIEGPPGVGKTELAKTTAEMFALPLIRLVLDGARRGLRQGERLAHRLLAGKQVAPRLVAQALPLPFVERLGQHGAAPQDEHGQPRNESFAGFARRAAESRAKSEGVI